MGISGSPICICWTFLQVKEKEMVPDTYCARMPGSVINLHPHYNSVQWVFQPILKYGKLRHREVKSMVFTLTPCSGISEMLL